MKEGRRPLRFLWGDGLALGVGVALALYAAFSAAGLPPAQLREAERSFWAAALIMAVLASVALIYYIQRVPQLSDRPERRRLASSAVGFVVPLAAAGGLLLAQSSGQVRFWVLGGLGGILIWGEIGHLTLVLLTKRAAR